MKIKLLNGNIYDVVRAEVTNGRLELDFHNKTAEELQDTFSVPALLTNIELLTDTEDKTGDVPGWTVYGGVMTLGDTKTVILTKAVNITEQRLADAEAKAQKKAEQTIAENAAQCEALKRAARARLDKAAGLIVGRVGSS